MPEETSPTNSMLELKLDYIQKDITTIKLDVKEMKSDYITRREYDIVLVNIKQLIVDEIQVVNDKISPLARFVYGIITLMGIAVLGAIFQLILKK